MDALEDHADAAAQAVEIDLGPVTSCPPTRSCPPSVPRRLMQRRQVLLPEPEEPTITTASPLPTLRSTPRRTSTWPKLCAALDRHDRLGRRSRHGGREVTCRRPWSRHSLQIGAPVPG
jgi:hypothetical protein